MVYKESPLCSQGPAFGCKSTESLPTCLKNLLPNSFGALTLCLRHPTTFLGAHLGFGAVFSPPCCWLSSIPSLPGATRCVDLREGSLSPSELRRQVSVTQRNVERLRNQVGSPAHQTGKSPGSKSGLPKEAEGDSDQLLAETL
jgi:hypothetical protein